MLFYTYLLIIVLLAYSYCLCSATVLFLFVIIVTNHSVQINKCFFPLSIRYFNSFNAYRNRDQRLPYLPKHRRHKFLVPTLLQSLAPTPFPKRVDIRQAAGRKISCQIFITTWWKTCWTDPCGIRVRNWWWRYLNSFCNNLSDPLIPWLNVLDEAQKNSLTKDP
jgi:hypothetical protein